MQVLQPIEGEVVAEDFLSEALKSLEVPKIFPDGTIGRKITTSDLREFLTTYGDDPLSDADVQELIQVTHIGHITVSTVQYSLYFQYFWGY